MRLASFIVVGGILVEALLEKLETEEHQKVS